MRSLAILAVLPLLLAGCDLAPDDQALASVPQHYLVTAVGRLDSAQEARNLVAAADGTIAELLVDRGDRVRRGQALLRVECAQRRASADAMSAQSEAMQAAAITLAQGARAEEIAEAVAAVGQASASARNLEERRLQAERLIAQGFVSQRDLAARNYEHLAALEAVKAAEARLARLRNGPRQSELDERNAAAGAASRQARAASAMADQCVLTSPIDGEVLQVLRREGEFSGASQGVPLIVVGDLGALMVRAEINERDVALVRPGQMADIWIEGQPQRWRGRVTRLASLMGRRSARSLDPTDRFDRDIREVLIALDGAAPPPLVGLRLMVGIAR